MTEQKKHVDPNSAASDADPAVGSATTDQAAASRTPAPETAGKRPTTRRIINLPLLLGTLIVCALAGPAAYFWHAHQVTRTAKSLLERADASEQAKDWTAAADNTQRYLRLVPKDVEAQVRLARTFDKSAVDFARKQRAVGLYYETIGVAQGVVDPGEIAALRGRLVELLLELRRFAPAEKEAKTLHDEAAALLNTGAKNPQATELQALAARSLAFARYGLFRTGTRVPLGPELDALGPTFLQALELNAGNQPFARQMAEVCRRESKIGLYAQSDDVPPSGDAPGSKNAQALDQAARDALADQTMDRMVAANPDDALAYLARYLYRTQYDLPGAAEDLDKALQIAPTNLEVCLAAAENALRMSAVAQGTKTPGTELSQLLAAAKAFCATAIQTTPGDARAYLMLGRMHIAEGQPKQAIEVWQQGLAKVDARHLDLNLRLAEVLLDQGQFPDAEAPLKVIQDQLERIGPQLERANRLALQRTADLLTGRWNVGLGKYREAMPPLSRVVTLGEQTTPAEQRERFIAIYCLGQCYARLGEWERAAKTFDDAVVLRPDLAVLHRAAAEAWAQTGQPSAVVPHLEQAVRYDNSAEIWLQLAQARLQEQLLVLPRENRVWGPFKTALAESQKPDRSKPLSEPWRAGLLEVEYILLDTLTADRPQAVERAKAVLARLETEDPDVAVMWRSLALIYQQLDDREAADRALERFIALQPAGVERYVLRSQLLTSRREFDAARKEIYDALAAVPDAESGPLRFSLVAISLREGRPEQAATELAQLQKSQPNNLRILQQLADMAFERADLKAVEEWETKLHEVEGPKGLFWRYNRARRLLAQARTAQDAEFLEAGKLAGEIRAERPSWPPAVLLSAMTLQRRSRLPDAIAAYQEAIRLGERRLSVYESLISLLYQTGRLAEAESYLTQLQEYVPVQEKLSGLEILTAASQGNMDQAIEAARRGIERRPTDATAQLWLGQVLAVAGQSAEAEVALRRAIELAPKDIRTYSGLLGLYLRTKRQDDARRLLGELATNSDLPSGQKEFVLAQVYQQLGDRTEAETHYRQALQQEPKNIALLTRTALFLAPTKAADAESLLRQAMVIDPQAAEPRRILAALLAANGGEEQWAEAQRLLAGQDSSAAGVLDRRLRAGLLARRGGRENLQEARRILEELIVDPQPVDSDRLLLARLCEAQAVLLQSEARGLAVDNKPTEAEARRQEADAQYLAARQHYVTLTTRSDVKPEYLGALVEFLLRQKDYAEAEQRIAELSKLAPDDLGVVSLHARLLLATLRAAEIPAILEPVAAKRLAALQSPGKDAPEAVIQAETQLALTVGRIYAAAEQYAAAEPWLRRAVEKTPAAYGPLSVCLAAQHRLPEGVQLCLAAATNDSSLKPVLALASLMLLGTPSPDDFQLVEPTLSAALNAHPDEAQLLSAVGDVRVVQGKMNEAIGLYERVLKLRPNDLLVINNLATLLGEQPNRQDEALEYVDRAIKLTSASPALLDTKGMILFSAGDFAAARVCLEAATWDPEADPRFFFHLAAAWLRLGDTERSRKAFEHAKTHQFEKQVLIPSDQLLLTELQQAFPG